MFNNAANTHQKSQLLNPFTSVNERGSPRPKFNKDEYGKWVPVEFIFFREKAEKKNNRIIKVINLNDLLNFQTCCWQFDWGTWAKSEYSCVQRNARIVSNHPFRRLCTWRRQSKPESDFIRRIVQCKFKREKKMMFSIEIFFSTIFVLNFTNRFTPVSMTNWSVCCYGQESINLSISRVKCYSSVEMMMYQFSW